MTSGYSGSNQSRHLQRILSNTTALLLDFDGPICSVFAEIPAHYVAEQLRVVLADGGHKDMPPDVRQTGDPFAVLYYAAEIDDDATRQVEAALRAHEVESVQASPPTEEILDVIRTFHQIGRQVAVVSNNSDDAVRIYLHMHGVDRFVGAVSARKTHDISVLKPSPELLINALSALNTAPEMATMVGDSTSDIQAATRAKVRSIGYANKKGKRESLSLYGADAVIERMSDILEYLR